MIFRPVASAIASAVIDFPVPGLPYIFIPVMPPSPFINLVKFHSLTILSRLLQKNNRVFYALFCVFVKNNAVKIPLRSLCICNNTRSLFFVRCRRLSGYGLHWFRCYVCWTYYRHFVLFFCQPQNAFHEKNIANITNAEKLCKYFGNYFFNILYLFVFQ